MLGHRGREGLGISADVLIRPFNHARTAPKGRFELPARKATTLHVVKQHVDWIWWLDRFVLRLVAIAQRRQNL